MIYFDYAAASLVRKEVLDSLLWHAKILLILILTIS